MPNAVHRTRCRLTLARGGCLMIWRRFLQVSVKGNLRGPFSQWRKQLIPRVEKLGRAQTTATIPPPRNPPNLLLRPLCGHPALFSALFPAQSLCAAFRIAFAIDREGRAQAPPILSAKYRYHLRSTVRVRRSDALEL